MLDKNRLRGELGKGMALAPDDLRKEIEAAAKEVGFASAGIASIDHLKMKDDSERTRQFIEEGRAGEMEYLKRRNEEGELLRLSAAVPFPWAKSVILCAEVYNSDQPKSTDSSDPSAAWIARYAWSSREEKPGVRVPSDYHKILLKRLKRLEAQLLARLGEFQSRCFVDTGPLVERNYARAAGLGWIGKNTCLLHQQRGSWVFLASIVTSLEVIDGTEEILVPDRCGSCQRCLEACPTGALIAPHEMDASLCISYLTIEKRGTIPEPLRSKIGRNIFGCDICQDVCPWNRKAPISHNSDLRPRLELVNPSLDWLSNLDEPAFNRLFNGSPIRRTGWNGLRRNIAIAMANSGLRRFLPQLHKWAESEDSVLRETSRWAIQQLENLQEENLS